MSLLSKYSTSHFYAAIRCLIFSFNIFSPSHSSSSFSHFCCRFCFSYSSEFPLVSHSNRSLFIATVYIQYFSNWILVRYRKERSKKKNIFKLVIPTEFYVWFFSLFSLSLYLLVSFVICINLFLSIMCFNSSLLTTVSLGKSAFFSSTCTWYSLRARLRSMVITTNGPHESLPSSIPFRRPKS